jgi:hypothetical protein
MVSFCCEIFLLCTAALVLTFFIAGLLFICALSTSITWERTASRPETGLLIPSVYISDLVDSSIGVYSWIPCIILRCGGSINRSERRDRSMKKPSEYLLGRLMPESAGGADYLAMLLLLKGMKSLTGSAEAGRALTAEVASRGSGAVAGGGVVIRS